METAMEKLTRLRSAMIARQPFFGVLASKLELVERTDIETASTDGIHLYFNPQFVGKLTDELTMGVIAHETLHCANGHFARLQWRDLDQANIAGDYAINGQLREAGFKLHDECFYDLKYDGMGFEDIYQILEQQNRTQSNDDNEQDKSDSNAPGQDSGLCGGFHKPDNQSNETSFELQPDQIETLVRDWQQATRQAARIAAKQAGETPGYIQSVLNDINRPKIDWRSYLAEFVNDKIQTDYSFSRPNKRFLQSGFSMPSLVPDGIGELVFFVDTSGSMPETSFKAFVGELQGLLDSGFVSRIHVVQGDDMLCHVAEYETGESIGLEIYGGGGTDFRDCLSHIGSHYPDASAMICFTDLIVKQHHIGNDPEIPTLWAQWGPKVFDQFRAKPGFGEIMAISA